MSILIRTGIVPEALKDSLRKARRKQVVDKKVFDDMVFRNKLKSFTVAGDLHNSQIQKIMKAANTAITRGVPFRDFKRSLDLETFKRITSPEVVFRNTAQNAYQLGRFNQQEKLKNIRPFGEYVTFGDDRVRPNHAILNARVAALDDAFWAVNYPPNGHQCRCVRRTFSRRQIDAKGLKVQTFDQINKDAAREQAARGIAPTKQVAPLADPGWQESFMVGDTGAEQFIRNFKNFEPAALQSIVSPKPVQITAPKIPKAVADTTNQVELKALLKKEFGFKSVSLDKISFESAKNHSAVYEGLKKKYSNSPIKAFNATKLKDAMAWVARSRIGSNTAILELNVADNKSLKKLNKSVKFQIDTGFFSKIDQKNINKYLITHEFAHTIISTKHLRRAQKDFAGFERYGDARFKKSVDFTDELQKIHLQWKADIEGLKTDLIKGDITADQFKKLNAEIRISDYANTNREEFFAESFTEFELSSKPGKFPKQVGKLTRKFWGK